MVRAATVCFLAAAAGPSTAQAGMTVYGLRDVYRVRLEDRSFFIFLFICLEIGAEQGLSLRSRLGNDV